MTTEKFTNQQIIDEVEKEILQQKEIIAAAQKELEYLEAWKYLVWLEMTAEVKVVDYLIPHYGETKKCFENEELSKWYHKSNRLDRIKSAISSYKSVAETTKGPEWAWYAKKCAKLVDTHLNIKNAEYIKEYENLPE